MKMSYPLDPWQIALNESPSEKEGKFDLLCTSLRSRRPLNESPSEKEGKYWGHQWWVPGLLGPLNESPSE